MTNFSINFMAPVYLALIVLSCLSWVLILFGWSAIENKTRSGGAQWFYILLDFFVIMALIFLPLKNIIHQYRLALLVFMTIVVSWLYGSCGFANDVNYAEGQVIGAGAVIQSITMSLLIIIVGSEMDSLVYGKMMTPMKGRGGTGGIATTSDQNLNA